MRYEINSDPNTWIISKGPQPRGLSLLFIALLSLGLYGIYWGTSKHLRAEDLMTEDGLIVIGIAIYMLVFLVFLLASLTPLRLSIRTDLSHRPLSGIVKRFVLILMFLLPTAVVMYIFQATNETEERLVLGIVGLIFVGASLYLVYTFVVSLLRGIRYGVSRIYLSTVPIRPDQEFSIRLLSHNIPSHSGPLDVRLQYVEEKIRRTGKGKRKRIFIERTIPYHQEWEASVKELETEGIQGIIPTGEFRPNVWDNREPAYWEIMITASEVGYAARFLVNVRP